MDRRERRGRRAALLLLLFAACAGFLALGTWQVERRAWKLALIRRVDARVHAAPIEAPSRSTWANLRPADVEYLQVSVTGVYGHAASTLVQAVTDLGPGFWLLTPLVRSDDASTVLVNRGWVAGTAVGRASGPKPLTSAASPSMAGIDAKQSRASSGSGSPMAGSGVDASTVTVTGLLRPSEPGGGFLRRNDPAADRWYSRDIPAIASARRLAGPVAPYFIDAAAATGGATDSSQPVGGLTVIAFHNNHLVYALTWYGLAGLAAVGVWQVLRSERSR